MIQRGEKQTALMYRRVFSGAEGMEVLRQILADLHFCAPVETPAEAALHNYAQVFVSRFGTYKSIEDDHAFQEALVGVVLSVPAVPAGEE